VTFSQVYQTVNYYFCREPKGLRAASGGSKPLQDEDRKQSSLEINATVIVTRMKPVDLQPIGDELAIKWDDGTESFIKLETLRRHCPCAGCKGEMDIMGNLYKNPDKPLTPAAFHLKRLAMVGGYAVQPLWGDGHGTGLFSFDYLREVAESE
jgi:DUF971 family protein